MFFSCVYKKKFIKNGENERVKRDRANEGKTKRNDESKIIENGTRHSRKEIYIHRK